MEPLSTEKPERPQGEGSEPPRRRPGASAPWWLWLLTLGGFTVMFWQFLPEGSTAVPYSPWFLDQVDAGTIQTVSIQGTEVRGVLRADRPEQVGKPLSSSQVRRFITYFPSEQSIEPVVRRLREHNHSGEPVRIETGPAQEGGLLRLVLLIQAASLLAIAVALARSRGVHA